jgi:hypothetical protein
MLKVRFGLGARLGKLFLGIAGILLGAFGYHFFGGTWIVVVAVFASLTIVQLFMPYIIHRRIYHRNPRLFEMRTVTFSEEGLKSEKATSTVEAKWSSFEKFKETKKKSLSHLPNERRCRHSAEESFFKSRGHRAISAPSCFQIAK